jgi:hypothetical protein
MLDLTAAATNIHVIRCHAIKSVPVRKDMRPES